jgi:hypothetical protein
MCRVLTLTIVCATAIAVSSTSAQPVLSRYRGVTLGDPVQVVVDQLKVTSSDVKVVHERQRERRSRSLPASSPRQ